LVREAKRLGIKVLTLFSFSSMNWGRPSAEVADLMELFQQYLEEQLPELLENGIQLRAIGERSYLPQRLRDTLARVESATAHLKEMKLILAVSYDGRRDMVTAVKRLTALAARGLLLPADVNEPSLMEALSTGGLPEVDLLIRSSGEQRLSGFLPMEAAYAELIFLEKHWPDFKEEDLQAALLEFQQRQRRFGLVAEQWVAL